eukprot:18652-Amphidinium_carterae.1
MDGLPPATTLPAPVERMKPQADSFPLVHGGFAAESSPSFPPASAPLLTTAGTGTLQLSGKVLCNNLAIGGMKDAWGALGRANGRHRVLGGRIGHRIRSLLAVAPTLRRSCMQALGARDAQ